MDDMPPKSSDPVAGIANSVEDTASWSMDDACGLIISAKVEVAGKKFWISVEIAAIISCVFEENIEFFASAVEAAERSCTCDEAPGKLSPLFVVAVGSCCIREDGAFATSVTVEPCSRICDDAGLIGKTDSASIEVVAIRS